MKIRIHVIDGYAHGAIQPSVLFYFGKVENVQESLLHVLKNFLRSLPEAQEAHLFEGKNLVVNPETIPSWFLRIINALNRYCGDQRFTAIKVFEEDDMLVYALPTLAPAMAVHNFSALNKFIQKTSGEFLSSDAIKVAEKLKTQSRSLLPRGADSGSFIAAAAEYKIPFKLFSKRYVILGYGSGSSILNSSITDRESAIGVSLAKNKFDTNRLLKMSGMPVASQARVRSIEEAIHYANKFGYPVVLKPENEEQGRGVYANIIDEKELRECFELCSQNYKSSILERFIEGEGYRILVFDEKVIGAWRMEPPSVVGDGKMSIGELIEKENLNPLRNSLNSSMKPIPIDYETQKSLKKLGFALTSVLPAGKKIRLAAVSNESRGGKSYEFLSELDPKNAELCIEATQTLRLHTSGVDLISSDASIPWTDNNTVICELNSQPQFGEYSEYCELYNSVLRNVCFEAISVNLYISNNFSSVPQKVFNKSSNEIEICLPPQSIIKNGCPTQYFNALEIGNDVSEDDRCKLKRMLVSVAPKKLNKIFPNQVTKDDFP